MTSNRTRVAIVAAGMLASGAAGAQGAVQWQALPTVAPAPADNPTTPAKVRLGKMLFFDPRLSSTGTVSCRSRQLSSRRRRPPLAGSVRNPRSGPSAADRVVAKAFAGHLRRIIEIAAVEDHRLG